MIDLTTTDLTTLTAVELRKTGAAAGIKGASRGTKADLLRILGAMKSNQVAEIEEAAAQAKAEASKPAKRSTKCNVCSERRAVKNTNGQCSPCYEEGAWENTHNDAGHSDFNLASLTEEQAKEVHGCWICYPELNETKKAPRTGRSRAGMVIVAKGTEIHKSETFKVAAEAAGWTVEMHSETYELPEGTTGEGTRYFAHANKGSNAISLAWDGRAYDYPASGALIGGKGRMVRNLKEALRLLVG